MAGKATKIAAGVVAVVILVNIMLALVYIASISEPARSVIINGATGIAVWGIVTLIQHDRDQSRACGLCQKLERIRCPIAARLMRDGHADGYAIPEGAVGKRGTLEPPPQCRWSRQRAAAVQLQC